MPPNLEYRDDTFYALRTPSGAFVLLDPVSRTAMPCDLARASRWPLAVSARMHAQKYPCELVDSAQVVRVNMTITINEVGP